MDGRASDQALLAAVVHEFDADPAVPVALIVPSVDDGVVTLAGTVGGVSERRSAMQAACRVVGVHAVVDKLVVQPRTKRPASLSVTVSPTSPLSSRVPANADEAESQLRQRVTEDLHRLADLDAERLSLQLTAGIVRLTGRVHSWDVRERIERTVWQAPGIRDVQNELTIG